VLLRGTRLPALQAAVLNASMGHALDFDDTLDTGGSIHPDVSVLASVLAAADRLGGVSGRDVLLAVALGLDVSCRIAPGRHRLGAWQGRDRGGGRSEGSRGAGAGGPDRRVARDGRPRRSLSITVRRTNGRSVTVEAIDPIGSPEKPLSDAQFGAKFRDCARNVVRPVSDANVDATIGCWRRCRTRGSCCRHSPVDGCASTSAYCAIDVLEVCNTATVGAA
jgi:2-methylcitrate dehydratase PrpD